MGLIYLTGAGLICFIYGFLFLLAKHVLLFYVVQQKLRYRKYFFQFDLRHPPMNNVHVGSPRGLATEVAPYGARWINLPADVAVCVCI